MFHPAELELAATMKLILADVERLKPTRVVFDSLSELRLLAGTALRYRRQILALKHFFSTRDCTVVLLDDLTATDHDLQMQSLAHGVVLLEQLNPEYGGERRRLRVVKYRGVKFRGGYHDFVLDSGGLRVFPRLVAAEHRQVSSRIKLRSGIDALDTLLGGGIEEGTSTLLVGAAGTGKSTLAGQFAVAAAVDGRRSALFIFDESPATLLTRCDALNVDLQRQVDAGLVSLQQVDPAELTPGEFVHAIRTAVEDRDAKIVVIDSLNGYMNAMPEERHLTIHLHELLMYLSQKGVATILIGAHQGLDRRPDDDAGGRHLPRRRRHPAALLREQGGGPAGHLGDEEARQQARADAAGLPPRRRKDRHRRAAAGIPWRVDRGAGLRGARDSGGR